jgi:hypothetical protein
MPYLILEIAIDAAATDELKLAAGGNQTMRQNNRQVSASDFSDSAVCSVRSRFRCVLRGGEF